MEIKKHIFKKARHVSIFHLTDLHEGAAGHDSESLAKAIKYIQLTATVRDQVIVQLGGDLIDSIDISDKRFSPTEISSKYKLRDLKDLPRKQADYVIEELQPIHKYIEFALIGNHEQSYIKKHYFDVYDYYCKILKCQKLGGFGIVRYTIQPKVTAEGGYNIDFAQAHGAGGGGKLPGYPINYVFDIFDKFECDFNVAGHIHKLMSHPIQKIRLNKMLQPSLKTRWFGVAGCFLNTYAEGSSGYFEGRQGQHAGIGMLEAQIDICDHNSKCETQLKEIRFS